MRQAIFVSLPYTKSIFFRAAFYPTTVVENGLPPRSEIPLLYSCSRLKCIHHQLHRHPRCFERVDEYVDAKYQLMETGIGA